MSCFLSTVEPKTYKEALKDEFWIAAMQDELLQFKRNNVWYLTPRPAGVNVIGTKWIFKNKSDASGVVVRNKARIVAQGYTQVEGIDFDETFAPVARLESVRMLLVIACLRKFKVFQMDVKTAVLNGIVKEEVYVEQPKGFEDPHFPGYVYRLNKALYGLKQAPRAWYDRLTSFLIQKNYKRGGADRTLFVLQHKEDLLIVQIYVDDIIFGSTSDAMVQGFVELMQTEFEMSMVGELTYFLGLQVKQKKHGMFISRTKYAQNLVKKFGILSARSFKTPMSTTEKLHIDKDGKDVDPTLYRSMIGSLLYLTASRPDICLASGICARFQGAPKESHLAAVKRIIRYVRSTSEYGIWFSKDQDARLIGYSDSDWASNADDRKSTTGGCFFNGSNLVSWYSKKQISISLSTVVAEYIAVGSCCGQMLWMKQMFKDYGFDNVELTVLCDNKNAIDISKNPVQHSRTKHIDIRHHFIRDLVERQEVVLKHVSTDDQIADIFTKSLDRERFEELRKLLGVCWFEQPQSQ